MNANRDDVVPIVEMSDGKSFNIIWTNGAQFIEAQCKDLKTNRKRL